MFKHKIEPLFS